jgi:hypothetical protein
MLPRCAARSRWRFGTLDPATAQEAVAQPRRTASVAPVTTPRRCNRRSARRRRRRGVVRRVRQHCGARHCGLGTLMRHDLPGTQALAIAPRAMRMRNSSAAAALVAPARPTPRLAPSSTGALPPAIPLAAITAAAHQHLHAAAGTGECPGIALHLALLRSTHRRLARVASTSPQQPASAWTNTDAGCHTAHALAATYARVGRGGFTACANRFGRRARLLDQSRFYAKRGVVRLMRPPSRCRASRRPPPSSSRSFGSSCITESSSGLPSPHRQGREDGSLDLSPTPR